MFKLSLDALLIVDAIERRGSFAKAGEELHRVPSTISYSVARLESELGVQLFVRKGPHVHLTAAGRELLHEGRSLMLAAQELEYRVKRVASGWETELTLGLDGAFASAALTADLTDFYQVAPHTRMRVVQETLTGAWEALLDRRVDLLICAAGEGPAGGGYVAQPMGRLGFVFAVAPAHPLAQLPEPLLREDLQAHRAVVVADSARRLAPRSVGILLGQETLTVPSMQAKLDLQVAGLGFGFLPEPCARLALASGALVQKQVAEGRADELFYLAWRVGEDGQALRWWRTRMQAATSFPRLLAYLPKVGVT